MLPPPQRAFPVVLIHAFNYWQTLRVVLRVSLLRRHTLCTALLFCIKIKALRSFCHSFSICTRFNIMHLALLSQRAPAKEIGFKSVGRGKVKQCCVPWTSLLFQSQAQGILRNYRRTRTFMRWWKEIFFFTSEDSNCHNYGKWVLKISLSPPPSTDAQMLDRRLFRKIIKD